MTIQPLPGGSGSIGAVALFGPDRFEQELVEPPRS